MIDTAKAKIRFAVEHFVDSQFYGDLNSLGNIPAINIKEIRYLPSNESVTRYGMQYGNGVIEIRTR